jgi:hypothetical protein
MKPAARMYRHDLGHEKFFRTLRKIHRPNLPTSRFSPDWEGAAFALLRE